MDHQTKLDNATNDIINILQSHNEQRLANTYKQVVTSQGYNEAYGNLINVLARSNDNQLYTTLIDALGQAYKNDIIEDQNEEDENNTTPQIVVYEDAGTGEDEIMPSTLRKRRTDIVQTNNIDLTELRNEIQLIKKQIEQLKLDYQVTIQTLEKQYAIQHNTTIKYTKNDYKRVDESLKNLEAKAKSLEENSKPKNYDNDIRRIDGDLKTLYDQQEKATEDLKCDISSIDSKIKDLKDRTKKLEEQLQQYITQAKTQAKIEQPQQHQQQQKQNKDDVIADNVDVDNEIGRLTGLVTSLEEQHNVIKTSNDNVIVEVTQIRESLVGFTVDTKKRLTEHDTQLKNNQDNQKSLEANINAIDERVEELELCTQNVNHEISIDEELELRDVNTKKVSKNLFIVYKTLLKRRRCKFTNTRSRQTLKNDDNGKDKKRNSSRSSNVVTKPVNVVNTVLIVIITLYINFLVSYLLSYIDNLLYTPT